MGSRTRRRLASSPANRGLASPVVSEEAMKNTTDLYFVSWEAIITERKEGIWRRNFTAFRS